MLVHEVLYRQVVASKAHSIEVSCRDGANSVKIAAMQV